MYGTSYYDYYDYRLNSWLVSLKWLSSSTEAAIMGALGAAVPVN